MIKKIAIYDLDGTIIDSTHRYRVGENGRIDLDHWRANDIPDQIAKDSLLPLAERYKADIKNPEIWVIVATARACEAGDANYKFLEKNLGLPNLFIHRQGANDNRGGAELKIAGIKKYLNLKQFKNAAIHVYEDNINYLHDMCQFFKKTHLTVGHFNPSDQGH